MNVFEKKLPVVLKARGRNPIILRGNHEQLPYRGWDEGEVSNENMEVQKNSAPCNMGKNVRRVLYDGSDLSDLFSLLFLRAV